MCRSTPSPSRPNGVPRKASDYIPVQHRPCLLYSDPKAVRQLESYRKRLEVTAEGHVLRGFWDATLCAELKKKGALTDPRSLAFSPSARMACSYSGPVPIPGLFQKGREHTVHPPLLINYNLHPKLRFRNENIPCLMDHPWPQKSPKTQPLSFLRPFIPRTNENEITTLSFLHIVVDVPKARATGVPALGASVPVGEPLLRSSW